MKFFGLVGVGLALSTTAAIVHSAIKNGSDIDYSELDEQQVHEVLKEVATDLNKTLPRQIDTETRGDRVMARHRTIRYNYTLMNYSASQIDMEVLTKEEKMGLVKGICSIDDMHTFEQMDVTIEYAYKGNDGRQIGVISVDSQKCKDIRSEI